MHMSIMGELTVMTVYTNTIVILGYGVTICCNVN